MLMRNRRKTLLRDHSVPEVTLKAYPKHTQSQPYLRPSPLEDLKYLPQGWRNCQERASFHNVLISVIMLFKQRVQCVVKGRDKFFASAWSSRAEGKSFPQFILP